MVGVKGLEPSTPTSRRIKLTCEIRSSRENCVTRSARQTFTTQTMLRRATKTFVAW